MTIDEIIKRAAAQGVPGLPEPSRLTHIRIWPAPPQWVGEVGEPPHNEAVGDGLYDTAEEAKQAALRHVREARADLRTLLPAELVADAESWPDPVVNFWE